MYRVKVSLRVHAHVSGQYYDVLSYDPGCASVRATSDARGSHKHIFIFYVASHRLVVLGTDLLFCPSNVQNNRPVS